MAMMRKEPHSEVFSLLTCFPEPDFSDSHPDCSYCASSEVLAGLTWNSTRSSTYLEGAGVSTALWTNQKFLGWLIEKEEETNSISRIHL